MKKEEIEKLRNLQNEIESAERIVDRLQNGDIKVDFKPYPQNEIPIEKLAGLHDRVHDLITTSFEDHLEYLIEQRDNLVICSEVKGEATYKPATL